MIERLVDAVARFDYPRELLDIQVLDDSTDETQASRARLRRALPGARPADSLSASHQSHRLQGRRAGRRARNPPPANSSPSSTPISCPSPDFLRRTLPYFADPKIAMVQTRWTYLNRHYSALTEVETHPARRPFRHRARRALAQRQSSSISTAPPASGAARAIDEAGGWQHDTLTEDTDLSYRAQLRGWQFPLPAGHRMRLRAARGDERLQGAAGALGQGPDADGQKNSAAHAALRRARAASRPKPSFTSPPTSAIRSWWCSRRCLLPAMIVRFYQGWFQMLLIDLPLFIASSCSISGFYLTSQRVLYPEDVEALDPLHAVRDGRRHRPFRAQRQGRPRSASSA